MSSQFWSRVSPFSGNLLSLSDIAEGVGNSDRFAAKAQEKGRGGELDRGEKG
jgi:hypothetical protein